MSPAPFLPPDFILSEVEAMDKEHPNLHQERKDMINFQRRRKFSKAILHIQSYQSTPFNLRPIQVSHYFGQKRKKKIENHSILQVMQQYLGNLKKSLSEDELKRLSTKIESFPI